MRLTKRRYNWIPDLPDQRDLLYSAARRPAAILPALVDLREQCSAIEDQGKIGSCTANALAGLLEFLELIDIADQDADDPQLYRADRFDDVSRLFIYYNERFLRGTVGEDSGASLREGIKALARWGSCRETLWKYLPAKVFSKPTKAAYREALGHRVSSYSRLESLSDMRQCLADGFPFAFGFAVYESFQTAKVAKTGIMPIPKLSEKMLGGHAVMAVGYDDKKRQLIVRNSWGEAWGQQGYFRMPYAVAETPRLCGDFWTVRR